DYAKLANWEFVQQGKNQLLSQVATSLVRQASHIDPERLDATVFTPAVVEDMARETMGWCHCLSGVRYFFRYDWADGTFRTTETELPDAELAWARDTVVAYTKARGPVPDATTITYGSADGRSGPFRNLAVALTNDSYATLFGRRQDRTTLIVFVIARD